MRSIPARTPRGARASALATIAALALALLVALPAAAAGPIKLTQPGVSARSVTSGTAIVFRVTYQNLAGEAATLVAVRLGERSYPMRPASDPTLIRDGVRYEAKVVPAAAGSVKVTYEAADGKSRRTSLGGGTITVSQPPPAPKPTARPAPQPAPDPVAAPAPAAADPSATDVVLPRPAEQAATLAPGPGSALLVRIDGGPGGSAGDVAATLPWAVVARPGLTAPGVRAEDADPATASAGTTSAATARAMARAASPTGVGGGAGGSGSGGQALVGTAALVAPSWTPAQALVSVTVTTVGGAAMAMAFLVFGKRRRDGSPTADDETLGTAAASMALASAVAAVMPDQSPRPALQADDELLIPRWRRASLLEARKTDPIRTPLGPVVSLTFENGGVAPLEGHERRTIRYRVVRLLDSPDELSAQEVGVLDQGDEVQLLERSGPYWLVLVPDGRRGWLHRMTLGDVVAPGDARSAPAAQASGGRDDPYGGRLAAVAAAADVGGSADDAGVDEIDADVLEAYLRSIGRA